MTISILGGTGFIGKKLIHQLAQSGHTIKILSRKRHLGFGPNIHLIQGDLAQHGSHLESFLENSNIVFNCAGSTTDVNSMTAVNYHGVKNLLKIIKCKKIRIHWIQLSSIGVYGPPALYPNSERCITELSPANPVGFYEQSKYEADKSLIKYSSEGWLNYTILRPSNVIGSEMNSRAIESLIRSILERKFFYIGERGSIATYVHVEDVVRALIQSSLNPTAINKIYNLSCDCLFEDLINVIAQCLKVPPPSLRFPEILVRNLIKLLPNNFTIPLTISRLNSLVNRTTYPSNKIISELGFDFSKKLPTSITELVDFYFKNKML